MMVAAAAQAAEPPVPGAPNPWRLSAPVAAPPEWTVEPERDEWQDDGRARQRVEGGPDRARPAGHDAQPSVFQAFAPQATGDQLDSFIVVKPIVKRLSCAVCSVQSGVAPWDSMASSRT